MAKRNVVNFRIVNIPDDDTFKQLKKQGKVDPNAMYVSPDTSLKEKHITNCITEIPQDIKLELNNGTLTLKAGSKYYLPNGMSGSTPIFTERTLTGDYNIPTGFNGKQVMLFIGLGRMSADRISSGTTAPSNPGNNDVWYDTTNNQFKVFSTSTGTWNASANISLPIGIATANADGTGYVSIDQVFNGFGYIGSTAFALPGVKGMIPNGRNADGTLKNTAFTVSSVLTTTDTSSATGSLEYYLSGNGIFRQNIGTYEYKPDINYVCDNTTNVSRGVMLLDPNAYRDSGKVISFAPKKVFHAVDYSDFIAQNNAFDSELQDTKNDLANTKTDLANTKSTLATATATLQTNIDNVAAIFGKIYPVGAIYIGTQTTCPMSIAIPNSEWSLVSSGRALWTGNGSNANTTIAAGLPNITGVFNQEGNEEYKKLPISQVSGCFTNASDETVKAHEQSGGWKDGHVGGVKFDANLYSSIYRDDVDTVQPPAYVVNVWRRTK